MADDELIAKLHALKIDIDRVKLEEVSRGYLAAYELANALLDQTDFDGPEPRRIGRGLRSRRCGSAGFPSGLIWRWWTISCTLAMPGARASNDSACACRQWQSTWLAILDLMQRFRIKTISAFDERFGGSINAVFNWVQDYESELYNAGRDDVRSSSTTGSPCVRSSSSGLTTTRSGRRISAAHWRSHTLSWAMRETGDRLFRHWLDDDPRWGRGWIAWSDCHYLFAAESKDVDRALQSYCVRA